MVRTGRLRTAGRWANVAPMRNPERSRRGAPAKATDATRTGGLAPIWRTDARVLVLGSMPSVASLERAIYYGHPQNAFWRIIERLLGIPADRPREARFEAVREARLAIWDVVESARRPGSADAAIRDVTPNDIEDLLRRMPGCRRILFNGRKAEELWRRHVRADLAPLLASRPVEEFGMPSTSPAHAAMRFEHKVAHWREGLAPILGSLERLDLEQRGAARDRVPGRNRQA